MSCAARKPAPCAADVLFGRPWTPAERERFLQARREGAHLGEAAEAVNRSVIEAQTEFGIGPARQVATYRAIRAGAAPRSAAQLHQQGRAAS